MGDSIRIEDLQAGDVLLYRGTGLISKLIQLFDRSPMSHAALYLGGGQIGEAVAHGLVERDHHTSFHGSEWVKAYRLADAPDDMEPVLTRARHYLDQGNRYGYEQLLILGFLCASRRLEITSVLTRLLRTLLDAAATELTRMLNAGRQPMICSEFVYRTYDEAETPIKDAYHIQIPGMLPLPEEERGLTRAAGGERRGVHPDSLAIRFSTPADSTSIERPAEVRGRAAVSEEPVDMARLEELIEAHLREVETGETPRAAYEAVSLGELREATDRFVVSLYKARPQDAEARAAARGIDEAAERSAAYDYLFTAAPDFVTPADLYTTESLELLGMIE